MKYAPILSALLLLPAAMASAQDAGGTYVNIGEYTDDAFIAAPVQVQPAPVYAPAPVAVPLETYEIVTEPVIGIADPYVPQPIYGEVQYAPLVEIPAPVATLPYRAPSPVAPAGFASGEYEAARLAAYDANRDGTITTAEAIATLGPLTGR